MSLKNSILMEQDSIDLTPMIDVVFLLLIYFMVTMALVKQEADLGIQLPSAEEGDPDQVLPSLQEIEITPDGTILLNGAPMDDVDSRNMPQLTAALYRLKTAAELSGSPIVAVIYAHDDSPHQRSIDVLNACAGAQIRMVSFSHD